MRLGNAGWLLAGLGWLAGGAAALAQNAATQWPTLAPTQTLEPDQQEMFPGPPGNPPVTLYFGAALAVAGSTALIGMPGYPGEQAQGTEDQGAVAIFERREGTWSRAGTLRPSDPAAHRFFGEGIALGQDSGGRDIAAVQSESGIDVFRNDASGWREVQKLAPPAGVRFDGGLAIGDGVIFVGAPAYGRPGTVFVFEPDLNGTWRAIGSLDSGEGLASDYFGGQIAVSGGTLVVGAAGDEHGQGAAFVFTRGAGGWSAPQKLIPADVQAGAAFGSAVAMSGGRIVIGAPQADPMTSPSCASGPSGAVYVFTPSGALWREQAKIPTPTASCAASFGTTVAAGPDQVVSATPSEFPYQVGASYVYRSDGETYPPSADAPDSSLVSTPVLAVSGRVLFDGLPYDRGYSTGRVEVFDPD